MRRKLFTAMYAHSVHIAIPNRITAAAVMIKSVAGNSVIIYGSSCAIR